MLSFKAEYGLLVQLAETVALCKQRGGLMTDFEDAIPIAVGERVLYAVYMGEKVSFQRCGGRTADGIAEAEIIG